MAPPQPLKPPRMTIKTLLLTMLAMLAFAGNSLLCRAALRDSQIDPTSFTALRLLAGALVLWLLLALHRRKTIGTGSWPGALSLFVYAAAFSYAYVDLDAGAGALLLFGAVQLSMVSWGLTQGERLNRWQIGGMIMAGIGLTALLLPGTSTPSMMASLLMVLAGGAWGAYSLMGKRKPDPLAATAGNFIRTLPMVAVMCLLFWTQLEWDRTGAVYALLSGGLTSGIGYAVWYAAMPGLAAVQAASVQLSVPLITALAGSLLLGETLTGRLLVAGMAILGGITLVLRFKYRG